ncbi:RagB/SusD family nutrient uptake outer membrane protein [Pedobacter mucosus]|uniref:RagB/SusD family nutrient uptake outer membrane protein n=1 Tax=Pedobacter mucosus TaxID=2895286 RepID=UPI001EE3E5C4|nr:RagB/SusD family nutrient uptake outer membrane protein [Pedobacter mucosus]UKT62530.1 RagB/SusD family nutrient uptake outer membrane protein [Pedobacter mucosus]
MKLKIYSLIIFSSVTLLLSSCKKDFLEQTPITQVGPDVAFADAAAAEKLIQGAYDGMYNDFHIWDYMTNGDVRADNAYAGGDNAANIQLDLFTPNSTNGNVGRDWNSLYSDIKNCNLILSNVPNIADPKLDINDRRKQILAEASILRAYMYFNLVRTWGSVPLVLKVPSNEAEFYPAKASVDAIYAQIILDLQYGVLNARSTAPTKGIMTKGIANAFLAKVYASIATPDWTKVSTYADAVIGGGYSLVSNYDFLWDANHKNNSEAIWEMQYDGYGGLHGNWMPSVLVGTGWKRFSTPTNDLARAFDSAGDAIRKASSIKFNNVVSEGWSDAYWTKANYPYINKYRADDKSDNYILRLADLILLKAEALNELSGSGWSAAAPLVNQIRSRVGLAATTANNQAAMRLAIENERRLELAFEGHRYYDLLRTNRVMPVMNAQTDGAGANLNYNVTAAKLYFPIPQDELDKNPNVR